MRFIRPLSITHHPAYLTLCVFAVLSAAAAPLWASDQDESSEEIRQTRVVKVAGPGGKHIVAHGPEIIGSRGYLGVEAVELTPELRQNFGAPSDAGVMVSRVAEGSPAQTAGLRVGDVLTAVDDVPITHFVDLFHEISKHADGEVVRLDVWREASLLTFDATLAERQRPQIDIRHFRAGPGSEHHAFVFPEGDYDEIIELRAEAFDEALDRLHTELDSEHWQERLHTYSSSQEELLERLQALEDRLKELEEELDE